MTYITNKDYVIDAYNELFGCGGTICYLSKLDDKKFFSDMKEVFGHKISEKSFQMLDCLPVLGINVLHGATDTQYQALYNTTSLYIAESVCDKGIVIITDKNIDEEISELTWLLPGGRRRTELL